MTKAELHAEIATKTGFVTIAGDNKSPEVLPAPYEKRYVEVMVDNEDGTANTVRVSYLYNTDTDDAKYFALEPEGFVKESANVKKQKALEDYLAANYEAYFINRADLTNNWAEADVYTLDTGNLTKKTVLVYKKGTNPITDMDVI